VDAPPIAGSFVCNIGDMLQIWTNGLYQPTVHRVLHTGGGGGGGAGGEGGEIGESRISVPFFYEPNFDAVVAPLPQFCNAGSGDEGEEGAGRGGGAKGGGAGGGGGAKFAPIMYGEHLTRKIYSNFETEDVTLTDVPSGSV
jgi:hypothetical protein